MMTDEEAEVMARRAQNCAYGNPDCEVCNPVPAFRAHREDMIERVAVAQAGDRWGSFDEEHRSAARALARTAIEAMWDPTNTMMEAGWKAGNVPFYESTEIWQAMIDAALSRT